MHFHLEFLILWMSYDKLLQCFHAVVWINPQNHCIQGIIWLIAMYQRAEYLRWSAVVPRDGLKELLSSLGRSHVALSSPLAWPLQIINYRILFIIKMWINTYSEHYSLQRIPLRSHDWSLLPSVRRYSQLTYLTDATSTHPGSTYEFQMYNGWMFQFYLRQVNMNVLAGVKISSSFGNICGALAK